MTWRIFDTDALTEILAGDAEFVRRLDVVPPSERAITVVTFEELRRGRLADVRRAETRGKPGVTVAYQRLWQTFADLRRLTVLPYDDAAHTHFKRLAPALRDKVGVHDLRIAGIAVSRGRAVVTRNRRHFSLIPGLNVDFW